MENQPNPKKQPLLKADSDYAFIEEHLLATSSGVEGGSFFHPHLIDHPSLGLIVVLSPSHQYEKNQENLKSENAEGYVMYKLESDRSSSAPIYTLVKLEWSKD